MKKQPQGPITSALEEEIKQKLRKRGVVIWLDKHNVYSDYVDSLIERYQQKDFLFPAVAFRGSFLEMMFALEPYGNGVDMEQILIHMPGHTEDTVRNTPLLEFYAAGSKYKRSLETLVRETASGMVEPDKIDRFIADEMTGPDSADAWLEQESARTRESLSGYLDGLAGEWLMDGLFGEDQKLKNQFPDKEAIKVLTAHLYRKTGMDKAFILFFIGNEKPAFSNISECFAAWLMCVEYVHDLTTAPHTGALKPLTSLSKQLKKTCLKLIADFRSRLPETYAAYAMIAEVRLQDELESIAPEHLGRIDTFKREEERVLEAAVRSMNAGEWRKALDWAEFRSGAGSFWTDRDKMHRMAWEIIESAAKLGTLIRASGRPLSQMDNLEEALNWYAAEGYQIDKAHRWFEQRRHKQLDPQMPHFSELLESFDKLRELYRKWADDLAMDFSAICEKDGFIPEPRFQQREIYDQVVHPLAGGNKKTAYFLIDAFRFEMAAELAEAMTAESVQVSLNARYCELPGVTSVGMNVLAPVVNTGKLRLAEGVGFNGFKTGEYTVRKPDDRVRAMAGRSIGDSGAGKKKARGVMLRDICDRNRQSLQKSFAGVDLIVVHSREIDDAGESDMGLSSFEAALREIRSAWSHLKGIGVEEFVFTGDHGFMLKDRTVREITYGTRRDPDRRFVLSEEPRLEDGMTRVSLSALGYEGRDGYLLFRKDTAVFKTGKTAETFVHGGNSLQERIIPVLTVSMTDGPAREKTRYRIEASAMPEIMGLSRIQASIIRETQSQVEIGGARHITFALRVPDRPDIQVTIKSANGAAVENQVCRIREGGGPAEVLFDLKGARDERVRLEIFHPDAAFNVKSVICGGYFNVSGSGAGGREDTDTPPESEDWRDSFDNPDIRKVFEHIFNYGSITEAELTNILKTPRNVRRFSLSFDEYVKKLPFSVRIETPAGGKRYVKD